MKVKVTNKKPDRVDTTIQTVELLSSGIAYATPLVVGGALIAGCGVIGGVLGYQFSKAFLGSKDLTEILPQAQDLISKRELPNNSKTIDIIKIAEKIQKQKSK